jgi:YfiH family protein
VSLPALALDHAFELRGGRTARARFTTVADGDLAVVRPGPDLDARRHRLSDRPWSWLVQVHGADVVTVRHPGEHAGAEADAAVTAAPDTLLAVGTADCAPIALVAEGPAGPAVGAVHAGWRGLAAGVVGATADSLRALVDPGGTSGSAGPSTIRAVLGPCIHASCYEFGAADLDAVVARVGEDARGTTSEGRPALDLPAAVRAGLARAGVELVADDAPCTACDMRFHSHRARGDAGRQAMLVWLDE